MTASAESIAAQIQPALNRLRVMYERVVDNFDLTAAQMTIMHQLREHGASRISQVAEAEGIRMPTASNALVLLEKRNLVVRVRDDHDRRGVKVALTELGEQEFDRVSDERQKALAQMFRSLPAEDWERAEELVDLVIRLADNYNPNQISPNEG